MKYDREEIREKYKDLFEHSLDLIYVSDINGQFLDANDIALTTLGYKREEIPNVSFINLMDKEQLKQAYNITKKIMETRSLSKLVEFRVKAKDGNLIYVETYAIPLIKNGKSYAILGIAKNITDLKNTQERLKKSNRKYRYLYKTTPFSIVLLNSDGVIVDCNPRMQKMLGYKKIELIGRHYKNISVIHQKFLPEVLKLFQNFTKGEIVHRIDIQMYRRDGSLIWVNLRGSLVIINNKIFVQAIFHDITERKMITQKLKESVSLYKTLVKTSPDAVVVTDLKGKIIEVSQKVIELYGVNSTEDLIGKNSFDFIVPEDIPKAMENLQKALRENITIKEEYTLIKQDGTHYIGEINASLMKDINGKPKAFIGILRDITEQKYAEKLLKESEEQYRHLYENALVGLWTIRIQDGAFIRANEISAKIVGYENVDNFLNNCTSIDLFDKDSRRKFFRILKEEGEISGYEQNFIDKRGNEKYISISAKIYRKKGYIEGSFTDITDFKRVQKALQESEENYRFISENANDLIAVFNEKLIFEFINEKVHMILLGYSKKDMIGKVLFNFIHPEDLNKVAEIIREYMGGKTEIRFKRKDGTYIWLEVRGKTFKDDSGSFKGLTISRDVTERREAIQKLKESEEKFRTITEQSLMGIIILQDGIFKYANEAISKISGYSAQELMQWSMNEFAKLIHPKDLLFVMDQAKKKQAGETDIVTRYTLRIITKSGEVKWIDLFSKTISFQDRPADFITILDITARKEAEQKLKESEEKYRHLFESSPYSIGLIDLKGNLIDCNTATNHFLSIRTKDNLIGKNFRDIFSLNETNKPIVPILEKHIKRIIKGEITSSFEFPLSRSIGGLVWINMHGSLIKIENKTLIQFIMKDITEKKIAEQKLKESEEKYRIISENANDMISVINEEFRYEYINEEVYKKIIGYSNEDLIGKSPLDNVHSEDIKKAVKIWRTAVISGEGTIELRHKKKDGTWIWLEIRGKKFIDTNGEPKGIIISRDITKRKIAEQKLKDSEKKYRHLFESSPYSIGLLDLDGNLIDCNTASNQFLSTRTKEDLIGKNFREIFSTREEEKPIISIIEKNIISLLKSEIVEPFEFPLIRSNGSIQWINFHISFIKIGDETLIQFIIQDITEKKKAEQNLKKSEEKYRRLHENSPNAIILTNKKGIIIDYNTATEKIFGYKKNEMIGQNYTDAGIVTSSHMSIFKKRYEEFLKGKTLKPIEFQINKRDGTPVWVNYQSSIFNLDDEILIQAILQDITEKKKAELIIKEEFKKLKELEQIRKDLVSRVSHELKTPLIPVISGSELLITTYEDQIGKDAFEILQMINKGGIRLKNLIEKLINVSRIEYNKLELEKDVYDLSELIMECSKDMKYLMEKRKITLNLDIPESLFLEIDKLKIEEVITNLLSNAIKNTPPNGKISINLQRQDNRAILNVNDTGVGLTEKEMNVLFTRFGKIERYNRGLEYIDIKGSGLGLYISKEIIALHGGEIGAKSPGRNKGSTFTVKLPIK